MAALSQVVWDQRKARGDLQVGVRIAIGAGADGGSLSLRDGGGDGNGDGNGDG
jgi:hypothetical protein